MEPAKKMAGTSRASKEAVLERIVTIAHDYFGQCLVDAAAGAADPEARLRAVVKANVAFHATYPRLAMVANHELRALPPETLTRIVSQRIGWEELVQGIISEGNEQGIFACPDPAMGAKALGGMCIRVAAWIEQEPDTDVERLGEFYADFVLGALRSGWEREVQRR